MNRLSIDVAKLMSEAANSGVHYVEIIQNPEAHFQGFGTKLDQKKAGHPPRI